MRLGVFGGSFDPIHRGHTSVARHVRERLGLDRVWLVPSARPPHREAGSLAPAVHRYAMVCLATDGEPDLVPSPIELLRSGPSYTVLTLSAFAERHPGAELFFVLGIDAFLGIESWYQPDRLLELARLVVVHRPGYDVERLRRELPARLVDGCAELRADGPPPPDDARAWLVDLPPVDVSATEIRRRRRASEPIDELVDPSVERYIRKSELYR